MFFLHTPFRISKLFPSMMFFLHTPFSIPELFPSMTTDAAGQALVKYFIQSSDMGPMIKRVT